MRILIVKTSSLGDIVHCLPVLADIAARHPHAKVDWLVEEGFADLLAAHPLIHRVLPIAHRRWRKARWASATRAEIAAHLLRLREVRYDAVIDTQGLIKSAWLARAAHLSPQAKRHGHAEAREHLARLTYHLSHQVPWTHHAATRNRLLVAHALAYRLSEAELATPHYGLRPPPANSDTAPYAVLLHGTAWAHKEWPEADWLTLAHALNARGLRCLFPAGTEAEEARAARLSAQCANATALPRGALATLMPRLAGAHCAVGVDTGLTHLAAAFNVPTVAIFRSTDPRANGVFAARARNAPAPTVDAVLATLDALATLDTLPNAPA